MTAAKFKIYPQFSMRTLMVFITVACVFFALPGGYVVLVVGTVWMLIGAAIVPALMKFRAPIYRFLSGVKLEERGN